MAHIPPWNRSSNGNHLPSHSSHDDFLFGVRITPTGYRRHGTLSLAIWMMNESEGMAGRMEAYLNIISKRDVRTYTDEPIPDDVLTRILHAGRATGSARNRQQWEMVVVRDRATLERLAETVSAPANIRGCMAAVAVVLKGQSAWDGGRMAQNLMLAAWSQAVGSCPNTPVKKDECKAILGVAEDADVLTILSLGYPAEPVPRATDPDAILARIDRKPLEELVRYLD